MARAATLMDLPREIRSHISWFLNPWRQEMTGLLRENVYCRNFDMNRGGGAHPTWSYREVAVVRRGNMVFSVFKNGTICRRRQDSSKWMALRPYGDMEAKMRVMVTTKRERYEVVGLRGQGVVTARHLVLCGAKDKSEAAKKLAHAVIEVLG